ncbi:MAG: glycosyltransferase [Thermomicrobiales bacterium]
MSALPNLAVVVPALNEEGNIGILVGEIQAAAASLAGVSLTGIYVVDNGSTDATAMVAAEAGAVVVAEPTRGYGRACLRGAQAAGHADLLLFMDGDRSEVPAEMNRLLAPVLAGQADLVVGSRVRGHVENGALTVPQRWGNRVATWLFFLIYRVRVTDLGPYRAIGREHLLGLEMQELTYGWPSEMIARAVRAGLRFEEVPVSCRRRRAGESKVSGNLKAVVLTGWRILNVMLGVRFTAVPVMREAP